MAEVTQFHRDNLLILANFLERAVPPPNFGMDTFLSNSKLEHEVYGKADYDPYDSDMLQDINSEQPKKAATSKIYNYCGTTACAVGHGPLAGIEPLLFEHWTGYAFRVFGAGYRTTNPNADLNNELMFEWMFGGQWASVDNTPYGAAARIKWFLDFGLPESCNAMDQDEENLIYKDRIIQNTTNPVYIIEEPKK